MSQVLVKMGIVFINEDALIKLNLPKSHVFFNYQNEGIA
jgi:hypothetical protein